MITSEMIIQQENPTREDHLAIINDYQLNQEAGNQTFEPDIIDLISGSNNINPLSISDSWREIIEDLCYA